MIMTPFITVKIQRTGFHRWANAPAEAAFLSFAHRHTFHIKVRVGVHHPDRDVEFTLLKKEIEEYLDSSYPKVYDGIDFKGASCEMLSENLAGYLYASGYDVQMVSFSEDGEFEGGVQCSPGRS